MSKTCVTCGNKLGYLRAVTHDQCPECQEREQAARSNAMARLTEASVRLLTSDHPAGEIDTIRKCLQEPVFSQEESALLGQQAFSTVVESIVSDRLMTESEAAALNALSEAFNIKVSDGLLQLYQQSPQLRPAVTISLANAGILPKREPKNLMLKGNEAGYLELSATLLKEHVHTEYRRSSKYHSYRTPITHTRHGTGHSTSQRVVTGTTIDPDDRGHLIVTSERLVFSGHRRTLEMPYSKLLDVDVYADALAVHTSNRKVPPLFRLHPGWPDVVGVVVRIAVAARRAN